MKIFVFQLGLDPRATTIANLFMDATCVGEKIINDEYCFILKIETGAAICEAQSGPNYEIIHHTIWAFWFNSNSQGCLGWKLKLKSGKPALNQSWRWVSGCAREGGRRVSGCRLEKDVRSRRPPSPAEGGSGGVTSG